MFTASFHTKPIIHFKQVSSPSSFSIQGFGSQDAQGRQRLIEAINLVKKDFAKILVITHLDELKDAFPTRIEVEKTERGSTVSVK
jgi:exonuclease SbcC